MTDLASACSICYDSMKDDNDNWHTTSCGHEFHKLCIQTWYEMNHNTCPFCRTVDQKRSTIINTNYFVPMYPLNLGPSNLVRGVMQQLIALGAADVYLNPG